MRVGDTFQTAIWLTGREVPGMREQYEIDMKEALDSECRRAGLSHGPLRFYELPIGDNRVSPVPPHIDGPNIRLLVCEVPMTYAIKVNSFLGDLDVADLQRLRAITRQAAMRQYPVRFLTDQQCDAIIEQIGPESAMEAVRNAVDSRSVH